MKSVNAEHEFYTVNFFNTSETMIKELRMFIYEENCSKLLKLDPILDLVKSTDWMPRTFSSTLSPYVGRILHQIHQAEEKIKSYGGGSIPKYVLNIILYHLVSMISRKILEGYSIVKRCTEAGWKGMERDTRNLKDELGSYIEKDIT